MRISIFNSFVSIIFIYLLLIVKVNKAQGDIYNNHKNHQADMLKDFRPSHLISETRSEEAENPIFGTGSNLNSNLNNHKENSLNLEKNQGIAQNIEPKTESSIIQGRIFGGGANNGWSSGNTGSWGGGGGGHQCQNLNSFNPGCCKLGYNNCCHGSGGGWGSQFPPHRFPPVIPGNSWGSGKGKGQPHFQPIQHHHQQQHFRPVPHRPPHQGFYKPRPPIQAYPIVGNFEKPGSCHFNKPDFSFLNKFTSIFTKGKVLDHHHHHHSKGWGWNPYPPSQNAGYYFHRRSDNYNPQLTKRQLDLSPENQKYYTPENNNNKYQNHKESDRVIDDRNEKSFEASYPSQSYGHHNVGIGSLTGRILGGWGWNSGITTGWTIPDPNLPCYNDYQCSGNHKCCSGICKSPSLFG